MSEPKGAEGERETLTPRVLVAGVGNIFLGDDGFGVEVARRLAAPAGQEQLPDGVQVGDYGTSGMHLAYDLADHGYDTTILVDAAPRGEPPGTLTVLEIRPEDRAGLAAAGGPQLFNGHGMQPEVVLGVLDMLGAEPGRILVVACEPASAEPGLGLSAPVGAAVGEAVALVTRLAAEATSSPAFGQRKTEPPRPESEATGTSPATVDALGSDDR